MRLKSETSARVCLISSETLSRYSRVSVASGLTHLNDAVRELDRLYVIDPLCGIYNRNGFIRLADQIFRTCMQNGEVLMLGFIDMDGLKYVNDNVFTEKREIELIQQKADFIGNIMQTFVERDAEGNEKPYWDLDYLIRRFGGFTNEDLDNNRRIQDIKALVAEGYKEKDAEKIADGEQKSKFKKSKKTEEENEEGGEQEGPAAL